MIARIITTTHTDGSTTTIADAFLVQPLPVIMLDEPLHTDSHPFCTDLTCPCHDDSDLYQEHIDEPLEAGLLTSYEAMRIFTGCHV